MNIIRIFCI